MTEPHLDDEAISAVLDGEGTADEATHVSSCAECSARLATLREASALVGGPVEPLDAARRDAAIAAAIAASPADVVSLAARRRRRQQVPAWLGAAAAVIVAVVAIGALARTGDDDDADMAASGGDDTTSAEMTVADDAGDDLSILAAPAVGPVEGGDLGAIEDVDLGAELERAMARRESADADSGAGAGATGEAEESADATPATTTTASAQSAAGTAANGSSCEDPVRVGDPELGALVYRASGTYDGEPVAVLGFDVLRDDGTVDRRVYVVAVADCAVRRVETYSA